jgi:hypothetical protein
MQPDSQFDEGGQMMKASYQPSPLMLVTVFLGLLISFSTSFSQAEAAKKKRPAAQTPSVVTTPELQLSQAVVERDGILNIMNTMTCDASSSSVCQKSCGASACEWAEPTCRDCLGTSSEVMREIFSRLAIAYRATGPIDNVTLIRVLVNTSFVLTPASPYDYYNSSQDPGLASQLQILCGSSSGSVGVLRDEDSRPTRAFVAICNTPHGVQARILERVDDDTSDVPLYLKLTTELEMRKP